MELQIPPLKKTGKSIFKTSPPAVGQWVENLPLANTDITITRLEFALGETNSHDLPVHERLAALELLVAPVTSITAALRKGFQGKRFPLKETALAKATKSIELCHQMATGYKILVVALNLQGAEKKQLSMAIHRAMRYLSEVLIGNYQIYAQHQDGIWKDLHTLYHMAELHDLLTNKVTDITLQNAVTTTIETTYKQILLLALACPYRLRQNEIREVYGLLEHWAPYSKLYKVQDDQHTGFFTCHLESDAPPSYRRFEHRDLLNEQCRVINTSAMSEPVQAALSEHRKSSAPVTRGPGAQTLQQLMLAWGVMPKRKHARREQHAKIQLAVGLSSIHDVISGPQPQAARAPADVTDKISERDYLQDPTYEKTTRIRTKIPAGHESNPFKGAYSARKSTMSANGPRIESWNMQDTSTGGYCLLWDSEEASSVQIGELVGIRTPDGDRDDHWETGIVRWMRFTEELGLALGIQLLSSGAVPVRACICNDSANAGNKMEGILLPEIKSINQQATLLLPALTFRTGYLSTLTREGFDETIKLTRQLENTGSFAQFHFTPAENS